MSCTQEREDSAKIRADLIDKLQIRIEARFVPYSQSRNFEKKWHSLNWKIDVFVRDRKIFEGTDYSQGIAHAPSYNKKFTKDGNPITGKAAIWIRDNAVAVEAEHGVQAKPGWIDGSMYPNYKRKIPPPKVEDVLYSLILDGMGALDHPTVESWAPDYGYNPDSRTAERIYKECLQTGLILRNAINHNDLEALREAFNDY